MQLFTINAAIYTFFITLRGLAAAALLYFKIIDTAGSSLLNSRTLTAISVGAIIEIQLANFLKNLEVLFFNIILTNIKRQGTNRYHNNTIKVITKIAAISKLHLKVQKTILNTLTVRRGLP